MDTCSYSLLWERRQIHAMEQLNTVAALEASGALKEEVESGEGEPTMALLHSEMRTYYTYDTACSLQNVDT